MARRYVADLKENGTNESKTILLVDDEERVLLVLGTICSSEGYKVLKANGGREALELCRDQHVDLVILDIYMPDMNGLDLIRRLRSNFRHAKIIAISGGGAMAGKEVLQLARERGAAYTFGKPFQLQELKEAIQSVLQD